MGQCLLALAKESADQHVEAVAVEKYAKPDESSEILDEEGFDLEAMFLDRIADIKLNKAHVKAVYIIGKVIGMGAFGEIRMVEHKDYHVQRCLKTISKKLMGKDVLERVRYEIKLQRMLDHPNIIKLFEWFEDKEKIFIIMELCTGGNLQDRIVQYKKEKIPEGVIASILQQILSAVNYLHKNNIVHRDFNPSNILFNDRKGMRIKICDFGVAQYCRPELYMTQMYGQPYYTAPEVINGCYTNKCDIWSIGVMLHVMLIGRPPFMNPDQTQLFKTIATTGQISFEDRAWKSRSIGSIDLLKKLMHVNYTQRYSAEKAIEHYWLEDMGNFKVKPGDIKKCLQNFSNYRYIGTLQKAVLAFFVTNVFNTGDLDEKRKIFLVINKSANGMLSRAEFLQAFWAVGMKSTSEVELDKILSYVDNDGNGFITFSEFLVASVSKEECLDEKKLDDFFRILDKDGSNTISVEEMQEAIGKKVKIPSIYWKKLMDQIDLDGNGDLSKEEFKLFMNKIFITKIVQDTRD